MGETSGVGEGGGGKGRDGEGGREKANLKTSSVPYYECILNIRQWKRISETYLTRKIRAKIFKENIYSSKNEKKLVRVECVGGCGCGREGKKGRRFPLKTRFFLKDTVTRDMDTCLSEEQQRSKDGLGHFMKQVFNSRATTT